ncbi:hypothetical protein ABK54_004903 [Salmonella enterica subsp. enterica serovar Shubra]|nr:hypothetical protein [Salmonella enterica subsp. enterica serovar Give]EGZ3891194.1 hypothetical protein [Salmonella enterica subsp. enterica serovar Bonn]EHA9278275.1 hypothetical protein [Salmonella enterica subsp. enterica serovar Shubra]
MSMRKIFVFLCVFVLSLSNSLVFADTTAFGLILGKTTRGEFKEKYSSAIYDGVSAWTDGDIFSVLADDIEFEGVKGGVFIFNKEGKLTAIIMDFNKSVFDKIQGMLSQKYKVVKKKLPFVGDKFVKYQNDSDVIELISPHLSFDMSLIYAEKSFMKQYEEKKRIMDEKKESEELNQL